MKYFDDEAAGIVAARELMTAWEAKGLSKVIIIVDNQRQVEALVKDIARLIKEGGLGLATRMIYIKSIAQFWVIDLNTCVFAVLRDGRVKESGNEPTYKSLEGLSKEMTDRKNRQTYNRLTAAYKSAKFTIGKQYYLEMDYEKFFPEINYERLLLENDIPGGVQIGEYIAESKEAAAAFKEWQNNLETKERKNEKD